MQDSRPLVIDQPEDQLDARLLEESVLPALQHASHSAPGGQRQVILATNDAHLLNEGDPAQIVVLESDGQRAWVAQQGAFDQPAVREAVGRVVEGVG